MNREESIRFAEKYLEDLLSFFGENLTVSSTTNDDYIELSVPSNPHNSLLIGRNAETLRSFQYIVSTVLRNKGAELTRVNVDIADYKRQKANKLEAQARDWIEELRRTGVPKVLSLNPADRRIVHNVASEYSDIKTYSTGEGRERKLNMELIKDSEDDTSEG